MTDFCRMGEGRRRSKAKRVERWRRWENEEARREKRDGENGGERREMKGRTAKIDQRRKEGEAVRGGLQRKIGGSNERRVRKGENVVRQIGREQ